MNSLRVVKNLLDPIARFPASPGLSGTGTFVATTENDGLVGIGEYASGPAGRSYESLSYTYVANQWYCFSFELTDYTLTGGAQSGLLFTAGGFDTGTAVLDEDDFIAGGNGRYAVIMMDTIGGSKAFRLGVGVSANTAGKSMTLKNVMLEEINVNDGGFPSEYAYPRYNSAYNKVNKTSINSGNKVVEAAGATFDYDKSLNLLILGDSRSDEPDDIGGAIDASLGKKGLCVIHAVPGWSTSDMVGPTTLHTSFITTSVKAIAGTLKARTLSGFGVYEMSDAIGLNADVVIIGVLGVNDITQGTATALTVPAALANIETIVDQITAAGKKPCLTEITPWNASTSFSETDGDQVQTYVYNKGLKDIAVAKNAIFVPLYKALGDSTDPDKLSDGAGTTPDYSDDGLHINPSACQVVAGLIRSEIQLWEQSK